MNQNSLEVDWQLAREEYCPWNDWKHLSYREPERLWRSVAPGRSWCTGTYDMSALSSLELSIGWSSIYLHIYYIIFQIIVIHYHLQLVYMFRHIYTLPYLFIQVISNYSVVIVMSHLRSLWDSTLYLCNQHLIRATAFDFLPHRVDYSVELASEARYEFARCLAAGEASIPLARAALLVAAEDDAIGMWDS